MSNETLDKAVSVRREAGMSMSVEKYGIALDLGTSGVRGQASTSRTGEIRLDRDHISASHAGRERHGPPALRRGDLV